MSDAAESTGDVLAEAVSAAADGDAFIIDVDGFEGPLHVLLALARSQKVDLREISVAALADQYVEFIDAARVLRLELAADYLVMAAWLAYLKSRLLLPKPERDDDEDALPPEELARRLAFRLRRLEAMRAAADRLYEAELLDRDVFARGAPEGVRTETAPEWSADLYDLLKAYGFRRSKNARGAWRRPRPAVYALEDARARLKAMLGAGDDWRQLDLFLPEPGTLGAPVPGRASVMASAFVAGLELSKSGHAEIRQDAAFGPIYVRARTLRAVT
ncbi:MAG: segregation/condensation protein A [Caulobacterales bacterium]|nr:segregation/condensation protein A [Caulobacterales bacterium]